MTDFVLAWVMMTAYMGIQYSPPVKTLEDCQRMQAMADKYSTARTQCVQINVLRRQEK